MSAKHTSVIETVGATATDFQATLDTADLHWDVVEDTVQSGSGIVFPRRKMLSRSDNNMPLGIVGTDYVSTKPADFLAGQYELAELMKGKVVRAGFIGERAKAISFVELDSISLPKAIRKRGDPMKVYLYSTDGWDGWQPRRSRLFIERVACANGMMSREIKADLWVSHTKGLEGRYIVRRGEFVSEVTKVVENVREEFIALARRNMDQPMMLEFLKKLMPGDAKQVENRRQKILHLFSEGEGNQGATRWDAFNAITEYVTHDRTFRETDMTSVATNRFLGVVENNTLTDRALALLRA